MKRYLSIFAVVMVCAGSLFSCEKEFAFEIQADSAPYMGVNENQEVYGDFSNVVRLEKGITVDEAFDIAEQDQEIAYFVRCKSPCKVVDGVETCEEALVLEEGDTVFFSSTSDLSLNAAPGFADTYIKVAVDTDVE